MSRIDILENERKDFFLFVDEFQNFVSIETFENILSEARKYRLCLALAHQYIGQLDEELRKAIFGNVGTIITFPIGSENGETLEKEFYPEFNRQDLINLDKHHIYLKLAIDGRTSEPFSALTWVRSLVLRSKGIGGRWLKSRERDMRERERRLRGRLRDGVEKARMEEKGITKMILFLLDFILAGRRKVNEKL